MKHFKTIFTKLLVLVFFATFIITSCNKNEEPNAVNTIVNDDEDLYKQKLSSIYPFSKEIEVKAENSATTAVITVFSFEESSLSITDESFKISSSYQNYDSEISSNVSSEAEISKEEEDIEGITYHFEKIDMQEGHNVLHFNLSEMSNVNQSSKMGKRSPRNFSRNNGNSPSSGDVIGFDGTAPNCGHTHFKYQRQGGWGFWYTQSGCNITTTNSNPVGCTGGTWEPVVRLRIDPDNNCNWNLSGYSFSFRTM